MVRELEAGQGEEAGTVGGQHRAVNGSAIELRLDESVRPHAQPVWAQLRAFTDAMLQGAHGSGVDASGIGLDARGGKGGARINAEHASVVVGSVRHPAPVLGPLPAGEGREKAALLGRTPIVEDAFAPHGSPERRSVETMTGGERAQVRELVEDGPLAPATDSEVALAFDDHRRVKVQVEQPALISGELIGAVDSPLQPPGRGHSGRSGALDVLPYAPRGRERGDGSVSKPLQDVARQPSVPDSLSPGEDGHAVGVMRRVSAALARAIGNDQGEIKVLPPRTRSGRSGMRRGPSLVQQHGSGDTGHCLTVCEAGDAPGAQNAFGANLGLDEFAHPGQAAPEGLQPFGNDLGVSPAPTAEGRAKRDDTVLVLDAVAGKGAGDPAAQ